jgi:hypothetical protein
MMRRWKCLRDSSSTTSHQVIVGVAVENEKKTVTCYRFVSNRRHDDKTVTTLQIFLMKVKNLADEIRCSNVLEYCSLLEYVLPIPDIPTML